MRKDCWVRQRRNSAALRFWYVRTKLCKSAYVDLVNQPTRSKKRWSMCSFGCFRYNTFGHYRSGIHATFSRPRIENKTSIKRDRRRIDQQLAVVKQLSDLRCPGAAGPVSIALTFAHVGH